jgi:outer membrane protein assembly factor BamB
MPNLTIDDLIFVGLRGYAMALRRDTGEVVWVNNDMKSGYTTLLLDGDQLIVSTGGYLFCLEPLTGRLIWQNPLKGYGTGVTSLASTRGVAQPLEAYAADEAARQQQHNSSGGHTGAHGAM